MVEAGVSWEVKLNPGLAAEVAQAVKCRAAVSVTIMRTRCSLVLLRGAQRDVSEVRPGAPKFPCIK